MLVLAHNAPWTQEARKLYRTNNIRGFQAANMAHTQAVALHERETTTSRDL